MTEGRLFERSRLSAPRLMEYLSWLRILLWNKVAMMAYLGSPPGIHEEHITGSTK
jgi:hypothetical protein